MEDITLAQPFDLGNVELKKDAISESVKVSQTQSYVLETPSPKAEHHGLSEASNLSPENDNLAFVKAQEAEQHAIVASMKEKEVGIHQEELQRLQKEAEQLEKESKLLLEEAEAEREQVRLAIDASAKAQEDEEEGYRNAEKIEQKRRHAALQARPKFDDAEQAQQHAIELSKQAEDHEFHAKILEGRAKALLAESDQMKQMMEEIKPKLEAKQLEVESAIRELEDLEIKSTDNKKSIENLPDYIEQCRKEKGILENRIAQLKEEIAWSTRQISKNEEEMAMWERLLTKRRGALASMKIELADLELSVNQAMERRKVAADEAQMPAKMANEKFALVSSLRAQAMDATHFAVMIQRDAIEAARKAMEIRNEREAALAAASKAEKSAKIAESKADFHAQAIHGRKALADKKLQDAEKLKRKADDRLTKAQDVTNIEALSQLHPLFLSEQDLLEAAPPTPSTPQTVPVFE
jgi:hypothetical protein